MATAGAVPFTAGMGSEALAARLNELADQVGAWGGRTVTVEQEVFNLRTAAADAVRQVVNQGEAALQQTRAETARELQNLHDRLASSLGQIVTDAQQEFQTHRDEVNQAAAAVADLQRRLGDLERAASATMGGSVGSAAGPAPAPTSGAATRPLAVAASTPAPPADQRPQSAVAAAGAAASTAAMATALPSTPAFSAGAGASTWPGGDPWAQPRSAAGPRDAVAMGSGVAPPGGAGPPDDNSSSGAFGRFKVDLKAWGDRPKLNFGRSGTDTSGYDAWRDHALDVVGLESDDVRRLLEWAELRETAIGEEGEEEGAAAVGLVLNPSAVRRLSSALWNNLKLLLHPDMASRAAAVGRSRGLELWRSLYAKGKGTAPQTLHAKSRKYLYPEKAKGLEDLETKLELWHGLGRQLEASGKTFTDDVRELALECLLPHDLSLKIGQSPELTGFAKKLEFVERTMTHQLGDRQLRQIEKSRDGDVLMGALAADAGTEGKSLQEVLCAAVASAVESQLGQLRIGKGGGKGGGGKGGGQGGGGGDSRAGQPDRRTGIQPGGHGHGGEQGSNTTFQGYCHWCGAWGHRQSQCQALTAVNQQRDAAKGKGKGGKGGKGKGGKGGKGKGIFELGEPDWPWGQAGFSDNSPYSCSEEAAAGHYEGPAFDPGQGSGEWAMVGGSGGSAAAASNASPPIYALHRPPGLELANSFEALSAGTEEFPPLGMSPEALSAGMEEFPPLGMSPREPPPAAAGAARPPCGPRRRRRARVLFGMSPPVPALAPLWRESGGGGDHECDRWHAVGPRLCAVRAGADGRSYRCIEAVLDSGAEETVAPVGLFPGQSRPSAMSLAGQKYRAANGSRIPNRGEQEVRFETEEGVRAVIPFQLADVERPLLAVSSLTAAGNTVILGDRGGVIRRSDGQETRVLRRGGTYVLRMWVPMPDGRPGEAMPAPFRWQGRR